MTETTVDGFDWGDCVKILGSGVSGFVVAITFHLRREPEYLVEYVDATGSPQERWWSESQLTPVPDKADPLTKYADNVVPLRRAN